MVNILNRRSKILMLINFTVIIFILGNIAFIDAATLEREWNAGDIYVWGFEDKRVTEWYNIDKDIREINEEADIWEVERNITSIDINSKTYSAISTYSIGDDGGHSYSFDTDDFATDRILQGDFIDIGYSFDRHVNETVLTKACFHLDNAYNLEDSHYYNDYYHTDEIDEWLLLEPMWEPINQGFKDSFNMTVFVDSVSVPLGYDPYIYNFTFGDFWNNVTSFKIMGKNTLEKALEQFTISGHWTFRYDLSNYIHKEEYNSTSGYYYYIPYEKYIETLDFQYTDGGLLKKYLFTVESLITIDGIQEQNIRTIEIALGGLKSVTIDVPLYSIFSSIIVTTGILVIISKKRKTN